MIKDTITVEYQIKDKLHSIREVKEFGSGGHVVLPKPLVGKEVLIFEV